MIDINPSPSLTSRQLAESLGVSESSVKRWVDEGVIAAHRTAGGHRRIPVAAAVRFIRQQRAPVSQPHRLSLPSPPLLGKVDEDAASALFRALHADDAPGAQALISGRFLAGADVASIADGMIRPSMARLGELWMHSDDGILIEHRAVDTCQRILAHLADWLPQPPADAPAAVTAAGPADPYLLPPAIAALVLREQGLRAWNLGPLTPLETLRRAVHRYRAGICSLSISTPPPPRSARAWTEFARDLAATRALLVIGGRRSDAIPSSVRDRARLCASMAELAAFATGFLHSAPVAPPRTTPPRTARRSAKRVP